MGVAQLVRVSGCGPEGREFESRPSPHYGPVAQSVEQGTENPRVAGSTPARTTILRFSLKVGCLTLTQVVIVRID